MIQRNKNKKPAFTCENDGVATESPTKKLFKFFEGIKMEKRFVISFVHAVQIPRLILRERREHRSPTACAEWIYAYMCEI